MMASSSVSMGGLLLPVVAMLLLLLVAAEAYEHGGGGEAAAAKPKQHVAFDVHPILIGDHESPKKRPGETHDWDFDGRGIPFKSRGDHGIPGARGDFVGGKHPEGEGQLGAEPGHEPANEGGPKGPNLPPTPADDSEQ